MSSTTNEAKQLVITNNSAFNSTIADDWECANDDIQIAQIAERQKQIAQRAAEAEQLKFPPSTSTRLDEKDEDKEGTETNLTNMSMTNSALFNPSSGGPIRLLRRCPESSGKTKENSRVNSKTGKALTLEEREAAYQQARDRIFGAAAVAGASEELLTEAVVDAVDNMSLLDTNKDVAAEKNKELSFTDNAPKKTEADNVEKCESSEKLANSPSRNYLSDVEMVSGGGGGNSSALPYYSSNRRAPPLSSLSSTNRTNQMYNEMSMPPMSLQTISISASSTFTATHVHPHARPHQMPPPLMGGLQLQTMGGFPPLPSTMVTYHHHQSQAVPSPQIMASMAPPTAVVTSAWPTVPGPSPQSLVQLPPPQYGQPPGFAAGYLPPQSIYQGNWWPVLNAVPKKQQQFQFNSNNNSQFSNINQAQNNSALLNQRTIQKPQQQPAWERRGNLSGGAGRKATKPSN